MLCECGHSDLTEVKNEPVEACQYSIENDRCRTEDRPSCSMSWQSDAVDRRQSTEIPIISRPIIAVRTKYAGDVAIIGSTGPRVRKSDCIIVCPEVKEESKRFICDRCPFFIEFPDQEVFMRHLDLAHINNQSVIRKQGITLPPQLNPPVFNKRTIVVDSAESITYRCVMEKCGMGFARGQDLIVHVEYFHWNLLFICHICFELFRLKKGLDCHIIATKHHQQKKNDKKKTGLDDSDSEGAHEREDREMMNLRTVSRPHLRILRSAKPKKLVVLPLPKSPSSDYKKNCQKRPKSAPLINNFNRKRDQPVAGYLPVRAPVPNVAPTLADDGKSEQIISRISVTCMNGTPLP